MLFPLLVAAAYAECPAGVTPAQVHRTVEEANLAYAAMDEEGFFTLAKRGEAEIACVTEVLAPKHIAAWQRVDGLRRFAEGDPDAAKTSFVAARALDREAVLPENIAPAGGRLANLYEAAASVRANRAETLAVADSQKVWVDGTETTRRRIEIPVFVQVGPKEDAVVFNALLRPGAAFSPPAELLEDERDLSDFEPEPEPESIAEAKPAVERKGNPAAAPMWIATSVAAVAAGGLFGAAVWSAGEFQKEPSEAALDFNHATYFGALGAGGLTVVLAGVSLAVTF